MSGAYPCRGSIPGTVDNQLVMVWKMCGNVFVEFGYEPNNVLNAKHGLYQRGLPTPHRAYAGAALMLTFCFCEHSWPILFGRDGETWGELED